MSNIKSLTRKSTKINLLSFQSVIIFSWASFKYKLPMKVNSSLISYWNVLSGEAYLSQEDAKIRTYRRFPIDNGDLLKSVLVCWTRLRSLLRNRLRGWIKKENEIEDGSEGEHKKKERPRRRLRRNLYRKIFQATPPKNRILRWCPQQKADGYVSPQKTYLISMWELMHWRDT